MLDEYIMIPRLAGEPFYLNGFPISPYKYFFDGFSAASLAWKDSLTDDQFQFIKEYLIYILYAPCWHWETAAKARELKMIAMTVKNKIEFDNCLHLCLDAGIDAF